MVVVDAMLGNAAVAIVLALVALVIGRVCRSPSVRHAAWLLVPLKLLTPPLVPVPLPVLPTAWGAPAEAPTIRAVIAAPTHAVAVPAEAADAPGSWERLRPHGTAEWGIAVWVTGALTWFAWQGRRVLRFRRRVLRACAAPPEIAAAAARVATALGIARPPAVKTTTGIGSPMLWGWGRGAVVLFPRELLARLSADARDTLLAHELAHYLRRDHWVRVLEFVASGLYWWHPAVWFARRGTEAAEEECCDAWVVCGLAASPRRYAEALLATVDFEAELRRPCLPPGACAAGHDARLLRRRLAALLHAERPSRLRGGVGVWAVVAAALLARPVLLAARPESPGAVPAPSVATAPGGAPLTPPPAHKKSPAEPRAWAMTAAPGGAVTVLARDSEVLLRFADGSSRVLGPGRPLAVAFAPGGQRLASAGPGPLVRVWDERGNLVATERTTTAARSVAYTPDGAALLVLDAAGEITLRDPRTLAVVAEWYVAGAANSCCVAPDGKTVAVSFGSWLAEDGWVELWSVAERRKVATVRAAAPVGAVRFSRDGRALVVGCWSGRIEWHALPSGTLVAERQLCKDLVANTVFSPDAAALPLEPPPEPPPISDLVPFTGISRER
ncbi:M56 family metallopeptidase [Gemmata massiliana]|uniref:M56 family metallopeptidase n=1 Tax=Gemmata massiliana TaxID=1210884 RepID=UPI0013A70593|nr:M56 family metallopeptidase [Gemmata massiliana]